MSISQNNKKKLLTILAVIILGTIIMSSPKKIIEKKEIPTSLKTATTTQAVTENKTQLKMETAKMPEIKKEALFTYSAWLPYWRKTNAIQEISPYLEKISIISPFSYEVRSDGTLIDRLKIDNEPWLSFIPNIHNSNIMIVPTIAWFNGDAIQNILSQPEQREKHIAEITKLVISKKFNGIDINYENKKAETSVYFSNFLAEISKELHKNNKILICSIEARTPLSSRFVKIPENIEYANDYKIINQYCDEVRILAYDQGNIDIILNKEKGTKGKLYAPVADKEWVEKVIKETIKTINPNKTTLAIATYGYEYEIKNSGNVISYEKLNSMTYLESIRLAESLKITPAQNSAGELSFSYTKKLPTATTTSERLIWFTDASAISDKIKLAKKYKLKGVIFFKLDGETDPKIWELF